MDTFLVSKSVANCILVKFFILVVNNTYVLYSNMS